MRAFIFNIVFLLVIAGCILFGISWYDATSMKRVSWQLPAETHIIAIGPSTIGCALNEKHISGFANLARRGTELAYVVPMLPRILDENPQIDTVLLSHGRFQFRRPTNRRWAEGLGLLRDRLPFLLYDVKTTDWKSRIHNVNLYSSLLTHRVERRHSVTDFDFGYCAANRGNLHKIGADNSIDWYNRHYSEQDSDKFSTKWILENCSINDYWIKRAIAICEERNVVPILFFTPLYQFHRWCPWYGFCGYMQYYDPNTLVADYEDFVFPNDSCYSDVHHLSVKGADYFTSYIAAHGIQPQTVKDWLIEKGY